MATNGDTKSDFNASSTVPLWLNGEQVTTSASFDVISPLNNKTAWKSSAATEDDATKAVASAEEAFKTWSKTKPAYRRDIFLRTAEILRNRRDQARHYSYQETGAAQGMFDFEFPAACEQLIAVAGLVEPALTSSMPVSSNDGMRTVLSKQPYGVVLAIAPWNAPHILGIRACLQPLAMGNTVVLKGPEASPATYWNFVSALHEAGLPAGCLNTIIHRPQDAAKVTSLLVSHPAVRKINFTGSTNVGAIIASQAGKYLKPTIMELGGKAPSIVCEDADIEKAALQCALGAFLHAGQICMATERIIVHKNIIDQFRPALTGIMGHLFAEGQGMGVPQLVASVGVGKNRDLINDAVKKGAKAILGDPSKTRDSNTQMEPIIIENVTPEMEIYHVESFGPTVSMYAVDSDEAAVKLANDTDYGLSSSVFSKDLGHALKIADQIESGAVHINTMTVHDEAALPHGGVKKSGYGRFNGLPGLSEWVWTKVISWTE